MSRGTSEHRSTKRVDANHGEIVYYLRQMGATVADTHEVGDGFPDIVVGFRGQTYLIEIKNPSGFNRLTTMERHWHHDWRGAPVLIVRSVDEALVAIGAIVPLPVASSKNK